GCTCCATTSGIFEPPGWFNLEPFTLVRDDQLPRKPTLAGAPVPRRPVRSPRRLAWPVLQRSAHASPHGRTRAGLTGLRAVKSASRKLDAELIGASTDKYARDRTPGARMLSSRTQRRACCSAVGQSAPRLERRVLEPCDAS